MGRSYNRTSGGRKFYIARMGIPLRNDALRVGSGQILHNRSCAFMRADLRADLVLPGASRAAPATPVNVHLIL
jgi:hypothetical protein